VVALEIAADRIEADVGRRLGGVIVNVDVAGNRAHLAYAGAGIVMALKITADLNARTNIAAVSRTLLDVDVSAYQNRACQHHGLALAGLNVAANCCDAAADYQRRIFPDLDIPTHSGIGQIARAAVRDSDIGKSAGDRPGTRCFLGVNL
jgi:hypothetical protein